MLTSHIYQISTTCAPKHLHHAPQTASKQLHHASHTALNNTQNRHKTTAIHLHHVPRRASHAPLQNCYKTTVATSIITLLAVAFLVCALRHHHLSPLLAFLPPLSFPKPITVVQAPPLTAPSPQTPATTVCFYFLKPYWIMIIFKMYSIIMFNFGSSSFFFYNKKIMIIGSVKRKST